MPEDTISGTLAHCTMCSFFTFSTAYASNYVKSCRKRHFFINKKEKTIVKASAAKIVSLAAFLQLRTQLFFRPKKLLHFCVLMYLERDE